LIVVLLLQWGYL